MKKHHLENIIKNKYSHLLASLIAIFLISPFIDHFNIKFPITNFFFFAIILITLRVLRPKKIIFNTIALLAVLGLLLEYLIDLGIVPIADHIFSGITLAVYAFFLGIAIIFLVKNVFTEQSISGDTIKGGISIYFLMGFWWASLYSLLTLFDPKAFLTTAGMQTPADFQLFSFTTLTTVGYGNTVPQSEGASVLASLEAITGPIYLAVFVARLVSLHVLGKAHKKH